MSDDNSTAEKFRHLFDDKVDGLKVLFNTFFHKGQPAFKYSMTSINSSLAPCCEPILRNSFKRFFLTTETSL